MTDKFVNDFASKILTAMLDSNPSIEKKYLSPVKIAIETTILYRFDSQIHFNE